MSCGVSSSSQQYRLALNILGEHFGPLVRDVGGYVLRRGQATLLDVRRFVEAESEHKGVRAGQVKEALAVLIQHNLLRAVMPTAEELQRVHPRTYLYYEVDLDAVTLRLRFPKFLGRARELFGEEGRVVLEEVLLHGRLTMAQLEQQATAKLRALRRQQQQQQQQAAAAAAAADGDGQQEGAGAPLAAAAAAEEEDEEDEEAILARVCEAAEAMARKRYLVRSTPFDLSKPTVLSIVSLPGRAGKGKAVANAAAAAAAAQAAQQLQQQQQQAAVTGVKRRKSRLGEEEGDGDGDGDGDAIPAEIAVMLEPTGSTAATENGVGNGKRAGAKRARAGSVVAATEEAEASTGTARPGRKRKAPVGGADEANGGGGGSKKRAPPPQPGANGLFEEEEEEPSVTEAEARRRAAEEQAAGLSGREGVLWQVGTEQFHRDLRHQACARFVRQKVNSTAEALVRAILQHSLPLEREVAAERSLELGAEALAREVPLPPNVTVRMYMDVLKNDQVRIVGGGLLRMGNGSGSGNGSETGAPEAEEQERYCVHLGNIVESLRHRTLHSVIRDRYARDDKLAGGDGDRNARICRVLLDKRFLDQQQLSELAMMSLRETRERLYHMYRDGVVAFQEVPRRADHHPNQTFYLWTFDARRVTAELVDRMYKGALNLRLRRQREVGAKGDLLANKDNIRDEVEAAHFDRLTTALDRLDQALENLDETIMLFTVF